MPTQTNQTIPRGNAVVINNCKTPIYLWSVSSTVGPEQTLTQHTKYTETYRHDNQTGGVSIKLTTVKGGLATAPPTTIFGYTFVGETVWYDLSNIFGAPFKGHRVALDGETTGIIWEDGVPPAGGSKVGNQAGGKDLVLTIC
ncbi:hypothetical protein BDV29DRAFT_159713 [Aspergillus leporis]|uniref:Uncharacterized protein n=1 Tax=Aspergillus leporis TaxID=41062 RepID=A0A5N5WVM7_9EURO|nr:hypothetical protein BDV29DRAFT_159713 [Aspergillus leporis]